MNEEPLAAYKNKFSVSSRGTSSSGSGGVGKREETLRSTPPTGTVNDLVTIASCHKLPDLVYTEIQQRSDWPTFKTKVATKLTPIRELIKELKNRLAGFEVRKKSKMEAKETSAPTVGDSKISVWVAFRVVLYV